VTRAVPTTFAILLLLGTAFAAANDLGPVVGKEFHYAVKSGDSLALVGARFGVDSARLARENGLAPRARLSVGQSLLVDNRHIVPDAGAGIVINVPQRLLFFFRDGALVAWYPVALGRRNWQTPIGVFEVASKRREPTWHVPKSIQDEMRRHGEKVRTQVPPGPENPLGDHWIGLSGSLCGIHGTNAPSSIYSFRTHGCIRLHPEDVADLFPRVSIGTPVEIIYEPLLLARRLDDGVYLEVNPDIYGRMWDLRGALDALAAHEHVLDVLDPTLVDDALARREGVALRVSRSLPVTD
jgi:L,D-transpeptidase ErfK/SrfK